MARHGRRSSSSHCAVSTGARLLKCADYIVHLPIRDRRVIAEIDFTP
jgi:hypothetical protein